MGGNRGGGSPLNDAQKKKYERMAHEELDKASKKSAIFISFANEDMDEVNLLRGHSKNPNSDLKFVDRSVKEPFDSERAEYIRQKLGERIRQCSTTVVYLSDKSASSNWVNWEVEKSLELGKRVIATHKGSTPPTNLPQAIKENGVEVVPWSNLKQKL